MVIGHTLQALVHHNHRNIKHKAEAFSEFLDARQVSIVKTFSFHNMYILNNIHIVIAESLDNAHLASRNPENASASGGKPPDPPRLLLNLIVFNVIGILVSLTLVKLSQEKIQNKYQN